MKTETHTQVYLVTQKISLWVFQTNLFSMKSLKYSIFKCTFYIIIQRNIKYHSNQKTWSKGSQCTYKSIHKHQIILKPHRYKIITKISLEESQATLKHTGNCHLRDVCEQKRGQLMQDASFQRLLGNNHIFFLNC